MPEGDSEMEELQIKTVSTDSTIPATAAALPKFKLMMLGEAGVGKTSITKRFVTESFTSAYMHTIGIDFDERVVEIGEKRVRLQVWDTAGQERFRTMIRPYYRGAAGIILVYDVTDARTFDSVSEWMKNIEENTSEYQVVQKVLVGNKTDMAREKHAVTSEQGEHLAESYGVPFFEVSAKNGAGVHEAFLHLGKTIVEAREKEPKVQASEFQTGAFRLESIEVYKKRERKCCDR